MSHRILLQHPKPEIQQIIREKLAKYAPGVEIIAPTQANEVEGLYQTTEGVDLLIAEVYIEGIDALTPFLHFRQQHPKCPVLITTCYDLSDYASHLEGLPAVLLPHDTEALDHCFTQMFPAATTPPPPPPPPPPHSSKKVSPSAKTKAVGKAKKSTAPAAQKKVAVQTSRPATKKTVSSDEVAKIEKRQQAKLLKAIFGGLLSVCLTLILLIYFGKLPGAYYYLRFLELPMTDFKKMVQVPAGEFVFQEGTTPTTTGEFYIDEYEVTIGQYRKFLKAVEVEGPEKFAVENMPDPKRGYTPKDWEAIIDSIRQYKPYAGQHLNLDCPVFNVDWWSAMAYAKWAGKRLPTEEEWEKAARGLKGSKFTWGEEDKAVYNANLGLDYAPGKPDAGGKLDGFQTVNPVNAKPKDLSTFGAGGMNGNVSEWTSTWVGSSKLESEKVPVVRGGSFSSQKDPRLIVRIRKFSPDFTSEWIGFRCASDKAPAP